MPARYDDFKQPTIKALAGRAGYRCSIPGCRRATVGPKQGDLQAAMTTGKAAHITAASLNGPRYDPRLSPEERRDISNGLWACGTCADIIDRDELNYSVETLRQFKQLVEKEAHEALFGPSTAPAEPTTLVGLGPDLVGEAVWESGNRDEWRFAFKRFIHGDLNDLRSFLDRFTSESASHFVMVESQGDARLITQLPNWETVRGRPDILASVTLPIARRPERRDPTSLGTDLKLVDGDLAIEDGDLALVSGIENAKQHVFTALATHIGGSPLHPQFGSRWQELAGRHPRDGVLLGRLLLLDAARLVNVPQKSSRYDITLKGAVEVETFEAPLAFVERFESINVLELSGDGISVDLALRWASTGEPWATRMRVLFAGSPGSPPSSTDVGP